MPYAHPLTGSPGLGVPGIALAGVAVLAVALVVHLVPAAASARGAWNPCRSGGPRWAAGTRALAAAGLLGLAAVARWGPPTEPDNAAAVAVPYVLWPAALLVAAVAGPVAVAAYDGLRALGAAEGRTGDAGERPAEPTSVRPAVLPAAVWAGFLAEHAVAVDPRRLAVAMSAYVVVTVAGCVAYGRGRWLGAVEGIGLVVAWAGGLRGGRLIRWAVPSGAAAVLGALLGGVAFARLRPTSPWGRVALSPDAVALGRGAAALAIVGGAALATLAARWAARRGAAGSVEAALVPVLVATVAALGLRRALVAAQLLPPLLTDPFDRGWRLLGRFGEPRPTDLNPGGTAVQQLLAWTVATVGCLLGALVLARRVSGVRRRDPAAVVLYVAATGLSMLVTAE